MQRKNPQYESMKEETVWDMPRLLDYVSYHVLPGHPMESTFVCTTFRVFKNKAFVNDSETLQPIIIFRTVDFE